ncbi:CRISPR-associated protein Csx20 [Moorella naiadis]|uniref:CRISPR-associated protein Csx20 n=1 Tax=Moorella naiadis (nom. illeg.) TaxID=3093670 RepID=UPI003D9C7E51
MYLLFSHQLTALQKQEAAAILGVKNFIYLPCDLQQLWSNVPPHLPELGPYLRPLKQWLAIKAQEDDYLLIQGDFGATYIMVRWARQHGCYPIYSTSERKIVEEVHIDGKVETRKVFAHCRFRLYQDE